MRATPSVLICKTSPADILLQTPFFPNTYSEMSAFEVKYCVSLSSACTPSLYSTTQIYTDECIARTPADLIPKEREQLLKKIGLIDLCYNIPELNEAFAVPFGAASFVKHSDFPNSRIGYEPRGTALEIIATKDIAPKEEITVNFKEYFIHLSRYNSQQRELSAQIKSGNIPLKITVAYDEALNRDVRACQKIKSGELIAASPVRLIQPLHHLEYNQYFETLANKSFQWDHNNLSYLALPLGIGSMLNHKQNNPNAIALTSDKLITSKGKRMSTHAIFFIAISDIEPNESIRWNYSGDPDGEYECRW
jgi:hypothetical protein